MHVGMLTAPFSGDSLDTVIDCAHQVGIEYLEVWAAEDCQHFDIHAVESLAERIRAAGLSLSSLAAYIDITAADESVREHNQQWVLDLVEACPKAGTDVLCCNAGLPPAGMSREQALEQLAAPFLRKLCAQAADAGINIALENWFATNIMHLGQWDRLFELVPDDNLGLNFDPSHLVLQDIDYLAAVEEFADRIFHTHAKDTEVVAHKRAYVGNRTDGWWRFVIPGFGEIDWGIYVSRLRDNGYDGVLSIEHEDRAWGREAGFAQGKEHLSQFV